MRAAHEVLSVVRWGIVVFSLLVSCAAPVSAQEIIYPDSDWGAQKILLLENPLLLTKKWKGIFEVASPPVHNITIEELEELRDKARLRRERLDAIVEEDTDFVPAFLRKLGLLENKMPNTRRLVFAVQYDAAVVVTYFKNKFRRARPWHYDLNLGQIIPKPQHPSYPSGHATQSWVVGLVLADAMSEPCRNRALSIAKEIGENREIAGVHFPSDTAAGRELGKQIYRNLSRLKTYRTMLRRSSRELASVKCVS